MFDRILIQGNPAFQMYAKQFASSAKLPFSLYMPKIVSELLCSLSYFTVYVGCLDRVGGEKDSAVRGRFVMEKKGRGKLDPCVANDSHKTTICNGEKRKQQTHMC